MPTLYMHVATCMYRKLKLIGGIVWACPHALHDPGSLSITNLNSDAFTAVLLTQTLRERIDKALLAKKFHLVKFLHGCNKLW